MKKILIILISMFLIAGCSNIAVSKPVQPIIDYGHLKIHTGDHYYYKNHVLLNNAETLNLLVIGGVEEIKAHMTWLLTATAEFSLNIYENNVITNNGTSIDYFNRNRAYNDTNNLLLFSNPNISSLGTNIYSARIGQGNKIGGDNRALNEIVLCFECNYIFEITSFQPGNRIDYLLDWYDD